MAYKEKQTIAIQDAMDNLAAIANLDMDNPLPIGIVKERRIVTSEEEFGPHTVEWLSGEGSEPIVAILDLTYRAIHQHLLAIHDNPEGDWERDKIRKGIAAMMDLVGESADKVDAFLAFRLGQPLEIPIHSREAFKALQTFYFQYFASRIPEGIEGGEEEGFLDVSGVGFKDFEAIQRDLEYELFYIRKEDGQPYFDPQIVRNIKLSCDFDLNGESFEEDPLLKVRTMQDRDVHASAGHILAECHSAIGEYYRQAHSLIGHGFSEELGMALMALFLAANPRHLLQNTLGKSSFQYFDDFLSFLRRAMRTAEYQKLIAYPPDPSDKVSLVLLHLVHALSKGLFDRVGGVKRETIGLIYRTMRRGEDEKKKEGERLLKGGGLWNQLSLDDEKMRALLAKFPNGPLFKILDLIREEQEEDSYIPFDPIGQGNLPLTQFQLERGTKKTQVIRLPCPTRQSVINKAEIVDEFRGFLRSFTKGQRHLMINLQDRTSWKEFARCKALEALQMSAECSSELIVLTLAKDTAFYYQNHEYLNLHQAKDFLKALGDQFASSEECGIFLPPRLKKAELARFSEALVPLIHELFFEGKLTLTRPNREDFIEIFYQFFILKCIEMIDPSSISFTCKDGIDVGATATGAFYGFIQLLHSGLTNKEEHDFLRWLLYAPALLIRERVVDAERLNRTLSMLERVDACMKKQGGEILKQLGELVNLQVRS